MRIEILRETSILGRPARVGQVVEVDPPDARYLVGIGKAREVIDLPVGVAITAAPATTAPGPEHEARLPRSRKPRTN